MEAPPDSTRLTRLKFDPTSYPEAYTTNLAFANTFRCAVASACGRRSWQPRASNSPLTPAPSPSVGRGENGGTLNAYVAAATTYTWGEGGLTTDTCATAAPATIRPQASQRFQPNSTRR